LKSKVPLCSICSHPFLPRLSTVVIQRLMTEPRSVDVHPEGEAGTMNRFVAMLAQFRLGVVLRFTVIAAVPVTTNTTPSHRVTLQWYGKIVL